MAYGQHWCQLRTRRTCNGIFTSCLRISASLSAKACSVSSLLPIFNYTKATSLDVLESFWVEVYS